MFIPWSEFWRDFFWRRPKPEPTCKPKPCNIDDLIDAFNEHLESQRAVEAGAAKNVEDAKKLLEALEAIKERKRQRAP